MAIRGLRVLSRPFILRMFATMASNLNKQLVFGSFGAAGFVALLCILDLTLGFPFARSLVFDITFLLGSAIVGYLAWDAYKDLA